MSTLDLDRTGTPHTSTKNGKLSPLPSISLTHAHISEALLHSPDNGATLDLAKKSLTDVGESGAEELAIIGKDDLRSVVLRIALGNNRLATLPMGFALLSRLRYLNLKNNNFSVFPEVLTIMPSLDTLDISHNKVKRFPSQPGYLIKLRVFCFSRNKITKLPSYLCKFRHLGILKADRNPIEWPPKGVMDSTGVDTAQEMKDWVRNVQKWISDNAPKSELAKLGDESTYSEGHELDNNIEESYNSWSRFPIHERDFDSGVTPHARSFSIDSNFSISSIPESLQELETSPPSSPLLERPPHLRLQPSSVYSSSNSPLLSPDNYLPSPAESADDDFTAISSVFPPQQHSRNASYAGSISNPRRRDILAKQSMPDLRTAKLNFAKKVPDLPERSNSGVRELPNSNRFFDSFSIPSPLSQRQDSGSSSGSRFIKPFAQDPVADSPTATDPPPSMDFERNSYFRRLSSLPSSTVSGALPDALLSLIDSARSILFAVCQVYQTLQHYTVHAIDDRLSSVLRKVLDPASTDMMQLINSLDRFDAMSRKTLPPPPVCRSVIESCRDTVAVFGKAVGVLKLQMKVLATRDDVRYLRQMVLVLYGATAEISHAWQAMVPHIDSVKPLLREHRRLAVTKSYSVAHSPTRNPLSNQGGLDTPVSTFLTSSPFSSDTAPLRLHTTKPLGEAGLGTGVGRTRTARRHAGSFSSKDVELGKKLPSYDDAPVMSGGVISGIAANTPTLRAAKRQATAPLFGTSGPFSPSHSVMSPPPMTPILSSAMSTARQIPGAAHSRQGSQASLQVSSASSSPSIPPIPPKVSYLEIPSNSRTLVDKEALDAMTVAIEAAPAVWELMDDILADVVDTNLEVRASLAMAKNLTKRLRDNIRAVQQGNAVADRKGLREDAHMFVKTVVQLSNVIKTYGGAHPVSSTLRSKMVKLTNSTEEFVILLHVSSFSPSSTPRSYLPMSTVHPGNPVEDTRLGPSLSRSRSIQPSASSKPSVSASRDPPRSALPSQAFVLPTVQRRRGGKVGSIDLDGPA